MKNFIKYPGGKYYLKSWIISHFPSDYQSRIYIDSTIGGGAVLLEKKKSKLEIASDINTELIALWNLVKNNPEELSNELKKIPYSPESFELAKKKHYPEGINEYVLRRMSRGAMCSTFAWSKRLRGNQPGDINAWFNSIKYITKIHERVKDVTFVERDFRDTMLSLNGANTFLYVDPPYVTSTRTKGIYGKYEMIDKDHIEFLVLANSFQGKMLISGYDSKLYNDKLGNWNKEYKEIVNHSGQNKVKQKRVEVLWKNY